MFEADYDLDVLEQDFEVGDNPLLNQMQEFVLEVPAQTPEESIAEGLLSNAIRQYADTQDPVQMAWIFSDVPYDECGITFQQCCAVLSLRPDVLRRGIIKEMAS